MKTPPGLQPLIDDGLIDEVLRSLKSGKEATVYTVRTGTQVRCAKVYRDMGQRSFQKRAQYQEGRKVRGSRQARALSLWLIHGDLAEFNVLVAADGPVIIDLPQAVNAAGNNQAFAMLERDVNNLRGTLGRFAPELLETEYAREIWALFEAGHLKAESRVTGVFAREESAADTAAVVDAIEDAREENVRRELGRTG